MTGAGLTDHEKHEALDVAIGAVTTFYNGIVEGLRLDIEVLKHELDGMTKQRDNLRRALKEPKHG